MVLIIFSVIQMIVLSLLSPFALGYFLLLTGITSQVVAVAFLTFWIYGICVGYGAWFHVWTIMRVLEKKKQIKLNVQVPETELAVQRQ